MKKLSPELMENLAIELKILHDDKAIHHSPSNLVLVSDKDGYCDSYYQANSHFFWEDRDSEDYITLCDNSDGGIWDLPLNEVPSVQDMIKDPCDVVDDLVYQILDHVNRL